MKKSVILVAALLAILCAGMVFAGGNQQPAAGQNGEWKWTRKVTFISPWGAGGGSGPTIRVLTPLVQGIIGVPAEVVHQEGGGGALGANAAFRQPADGYTFLMATQSQIFLDIQGQLTHDFHENWIPVGKLVHSTNGIFASSAAARGRYTDFNSFIAYIKANPGTVSIAMLSTGGTDQASLYETLAGALNVPLSEAANYVKITPYSGGAEIDAALVGGHVDASVGGPGDSRGLIESGDIIPLVVLAEKRLTSFPNIPCTGELGVNSYIGTWRGIFAKKGTPQAAIDQMGKVLEQAWNMKEYQDYCRAEGYLERKGFEGPADFKKLVDSEYVTFTEFLKSTGQVK